MVVHRHREGSLRRVLTHHVLVEEIVYFAGFGQGVEREIRFVLSQLLRDDVVAQVDAFIADVYARAGDELSDLPLALLAE